MLNRGLLLHFSFGMFCNLTFLKNREDYNTASVLETREK